MSKPRIIIDEQADALYIRLRGSKPVESVEEKPGIIIDYDDEGEVVGIEILDWSKRDVEETEQPKTPAHSN